jgi:endoglucanase Acf2
MVWGGKGANATWFTDNPEAVHAINWLPLHGGSLYLGHWPNYGRKNYEALLAENDGPAWDEWADLVWMYRALSDPDNALRQMEQSRLAERPHRRLRERGNSPANTYHWIRTLTELGAVDPTVTADRPLYAVFKHGGRRTYTVYNASDHPDRVTFSDGTVLQVGPRTWAVKPE